LVLANALRLLAHEGTALVVSWYGTTNVSLPLGAEFHRRRLTIRSTQVSSIPARLRGRWSSERRRQAVRDLLAELPLHALATHTVPFERAPDAFAALDRRQEGLIHTALGYQ
jgi:threonine dehydrogenase-like Zn-dependent dehydrogenase